jgi:hypothetical protein
MRACTSRTIPQYLSDRASRAERRGGVIARLTSSTFGSSLENQPTLVHHRGNHSPSSAGTIRASLARPLR